MKSPTQHTSKPLSGIEEAIVWLLAALKCENFRWDPDQHEAATESVAAAEAELRELRAIHEPKTERVFVGVGELERTGYIPEGSANERERAAEPPSVVTTKHIDAALMALAWVDQYMSGGSIMLARQNLNIAISNLRGSHCETASGATVPPTVTYAFNVGDSVRWPNTEGESRVTVIDRKVKYQVAWDGRPLDMWVEDHEIEPDSVSTKGIAP